MSYQLIVDETVKILETVTDIGKVHSFRRSTYFWEEFYTRHTKDGHVRNWEVDRRALVQEIIAENILFQDNHLIVITGWMSLNDNIKSGPIFQNLIESIRSKFLTGDNKFLNGEIAFFADLQVPIIDHVTFGGQAVHFCEIQFEARERIDRA